MKHFAIAAALFSVASVCAQSALHPPGILVSKHDKVGGIALISAGILILTARTSGSASEVGRGVNVWMGGALIVLGFEPDGKQPRFSVGFDRGKPTLQWTVRRW